MAPIYLPRLSPGWATLLLNVVALTYSTNGVFVKTIETAAVKPLASLACAIRFFIATVALAVLSQIFTSKRSTTTDHKTTAESLSEDDGVSMPLQPIQLPYPQEKGVELGTPRLRRGGRETLATRGEETDALFDISLDSARGSLRASPRLSPFKCVPGGWGGRNGTTPKGAAMLERLKTFDELDGGYSEKLQTFQDGAEEILLIGKDTKVVAGRALSPVVASLELGVLMFLGFAAQAIALETAMAGHVALLFTISVILVPLLESIGGKPLTPITMIATSLSVIGTGLLEYRGKGLGLALPSFGDTWGILSAVAFALHVVRSEVYAKSWKASSSTAAGARPANVQPGEPAAHSCDALPLVPKGSTDRKVDVSEWAPNERADRFSTSNSCLSKEARYSSLAVDNSEVEARILASPLESAEASPAAGGSPVVLVLFQMVVVSALSVVWWVVELSRGLCDVAPTHEMSQLETATWMETFVYEPTYKQLANLPWPAMVYTGVVSTGLCEWLEFHCLQSVRASTCVLIYTSISIYGAAFAWLLRGEVLGLSGFVGAAIVICASVWVQLSELRASRNERGGDTCPSQHVQS